MIDLVNKIKGVKPVQFCAYKPVGGAAYVLAYLVKSRGYKSCSEIGEELSLRNRTVSSYLSILFRHDLVVRVPMKGVKGSRYKYKSA